MSKAPDLVAAPLHGISQLLIERFGCRDDLGKHTIRGELSADSGYFRLGADIRCYGQCSTAVPAQSVTDDAPDLLQDVIIDGATVALPFDPVQIIENLRREKYASMRTRPSAPRGLVRTLYYAIRPLLGVSTRRHLQRFYLRGWNTIPFPQWPVDRTVDAIFEQLLAFSMKSRRVTRIPFIWFWPDGLPSCTIITHDVETAEGLRFCPQLMDLNDTFQIKSSFQIVPEKRYQTPPDVRENMRQRGFEIAVQDLNHDGRLFEDRGEYLRRVERINHYRQEFGAAGFRSAVLYRNMDWYDALQFSYDMSVPNVGHLDPQRGGCCTIFPYFVGKILELPVTTTQDYSLFQILNDYSIDLWKKQIAMIREKHGLISFIIHPDYIIEKNARRVYTELLGYLSGMRIQGETWIALPREVDEWWRLRSNLEIVESGKSWRIVGQGSERARLAYAVLDGDTLRYEVSR
jgi:hypothetical protein